MSLTPYQRGLVGKTVSNVVKSLVFQGKQASSIFKAVNKTVIRAAAGTIQALINWWRGVKAAGKALQNAILKQFPNFLQYPTFSNVTTMRRIQFDAIADIKQEAPKTFKGFTIDIGITESTTDILDALTDYVVGIKSTKYQIQSVQIIVTGVYGF